MSTPEQTELTPEEQGAKDLIIAWERFDGMRGSFLSASGKYPSTWVPEISGAYPFPARDIGHFSLLPIL